MFLVICKLIDRMSGPLGGDHDRVNRAIDDRLNIVIVGVNKVSKATCNQISLPQDRHQNKTFPLPRL